MHTLIHSLLFSLIKLGAWIIARLLPPRLMKKKDFFLLWERRGYHITPVDHCAPIPDTRTLNDNLWHNESDLIGININENVQLELLSLFSSSFKDEYDSLPLNNTAVPHQYSSDNPFFGPVDGEILYCMIRHFKPRRIIEIGSGNSTYLSAQAGIVNLQRNNQECSLISIDPNPNDVLRQGFPGLTSLMPVRVQDVSLDVFTKLDQNDILFIDSSHVLTIGSDVNYEILEILPRMKKGVLVHIHDIFMPMEYPRSWVMDEHAFLTEQYLLQAFLAFNSAFEILWAGSFMHLYHSDKLESSFPKYQGTTHWPGSFWMRRSA